jgi:hypothetical protein
MRPSPRRTHAGAAAPQSQLCGPGCEASSPSHFAFSPNSGTRFPVLWSGARNVMTICRELHRSQRNLCSSSGRAVRAPALALPRRVRRARPTRLPRSRAQGALACVATSCGKSRSTHPRRPSHLVGTDDEHSPMAGLFELSLPSTGTATQRRAAKQTRYVHLRSGPRGSSGVRAARADI